MIESVGCNDHPHQKEEGAVEGEVVIRLVAGRNDRAADKVYPRSSPLAAGVLYDSRACSP